MFCGAIWLTCVACEARAEPADSPMSQETITVDIKAGRQYGAGVRVRAPMIDTSFVVPEGWRDAMPSGSQSFLLGSDTIPGVGVVVMFLDVAPEDLTEQLSEPQVLEEGFVLHPVKSAVIERDRITASYHAGENVGRVTAVLSPTRKAVVYLFTGPQEHALQYERLLDQIAGSTRFTDFDPANVVARWQDLLAGMALKRIEQYTSGGGGGYNTSTVWNLCRDGRFTYSHASHVTIPEGRSVTRRSGSAPRYMACGGPWRRRRADLH